MATRVKTMRELNGGRANYRHQDPEMTEQFNSWDAEARAWVRDRVRGMVEAAPDEDLTVGDAVIELDRGKDMPLGYARYIEPPFYDQRYQMVRTEMESLHRSGWLDAGTTVNARGRADVRCYRRARPASWRVELEPDQPAVRTALEKWLAANAGSLGTIDTVMISRQYEGSATTEGAPSYGGRAQRRVQAE